MWRFFVSRHPDFDRDCVNGRLFSDQILSRDMNAFYIYHGSSIFPGVVVAMSCALYLKMMGFFALFFRSGHFYYNLTLWMRIVIFIAERLIGVQLGRVLRAVEALIRKHLPTTLKWLGL